MRRPLRLLLAVCLLSVASILSMPTLAQGKRVALVIGNSQYQQINSLKNPLADARAVAERLKKAGFTLLHPVRSGDVQNDLSLEEMLQADEVLQREAQGADIVFLYYAGHGLQMEGVSYLVPVSLPRLQPSSLGSAAGQDLLKRQLVSLDGFIEGLDRHSKVAVAVFDACREIPVLEETARAVLGGGVSPFRGLARPHSPGLHRLLAYSASPGNLALDGQGDHSPYTQAWLDEFDRHPGQDILDFFNNVAAQVTDSSAQNPQVISQGIRAETYFLAEAGRVSSPSVSLLPAPAPTPPQPQPSKAPDYGIKMVDIPATEGDGFLMGSPDDEPGRWKDEGPQHKVRVAAFKLSETEVTQKQWRAVMGSDPPGLRFKGCDDCPVDSVSFNDIQAFLKKTGDAYRLPTEAEWEYACRAGQDTRYCGGDDVDAVAWYDGNSGGKTHPVKGKAKNAFGLYDMSGNVWEWTADCWHGTYQGAPTDGSAWTTGDCAERVLRGGSWFNFGGRTRSAYRNAHDPGFRDDGVGFRLAPGPGASTGR